MPRLFAAGTLARVPITFYPRTGSVLICDFGTGFKKPEMVKRRPVVILSPWSTRHTQLFTVVPLSGTAPQIVRDYHVCLKQNPIPWWEEELLWAKCNFVITVGMHRLDRVLRGRDRWNKRQYTECAVCDEDLRAVKIAVLHGLGFSDLTPHL